MKLMKIAHLPALALGLSLEASSLEGEDPIGRVISLLQQMVQEGSEEKHTEEVAFGKFKEFCEVSLENKGKSIKKAEALMDGYQAAIDAAKAVQDEKDMVIKREETNIMHWTNDKIALDKIRHDDNTAYQQEHTDYGDSITACESALTTLGAVPKQVDAVSPIPVLMSAVSKSEKLKSQLESLKGQEWQKIEQSLVQINKESEGKAPVQGSPYAVEYSSGSVIDILNQIREKLVQEQHDLEVAEINEQGKHDKKYSMLTKEIANSESMLANAKTVHAKASVKEGAAQHDFTDVQMDRKTDMEYVHQLEGECETKASEFVQRQQNRADEITAMNEAISILSSDTVMSKPMIAGSAGDSSMDVKVLLQLASTVVMNGNVDGNENKRMGEMESFLKKQQRTQAITTILASVVSGSPFAKVEKLIKDLIDRLTSETSADADHREYCEREVAKNNDRRESLTFKMTEQNATKEELEAKIGTLTEHLSDLSSEIAELNGDMETAAKTRRSESKANAKTMEASKAAADAVAQAISLLQSMYSKIGASASLLQSKARQEPIYADFGAEKTYSGMVSQKTGVIGILRMIESSFSKLFSETSVQEGNGQDMHTDFMREAEKSVALKSGQRDKFTQDKAEADQDLATLENDYTQTENLFEDAVLYMKDLDRQCVAPGSYAERNAARQSEIKSLQTALKILGQERP